MVGIVKSFDSGFTISSIWGAMAIAVLSYANKKQDPLVGQSALIIFAASSMKILIYDLQGSPSMVRVGTLVVVGLSMYCGGWIYNKIPSSDSEKHFRINT